MKFMGMARLFGKHKKRSNKHGATRLIRLSEGFYKEIKAIAKEHNLTLVAAGDLIGAKAIEKMVEELKDKQTKHQLQELATKTIIEMGMKAKADRLAATPKKESPGETPGAAGH